jgi:hypothetical protein
MSHYRFRSAEGTAAPATRRSGLKRDRALSENFTAPGLITMEKHASSASFDNASAF